jgi:hypothetical protein
VNEIRPLKALAGLWGRVGLATGVAGHLGSLICPCGQSRRQPEAFLKRTQLNCIAQEEYLKGSVFYLAYDRSVSMNGQTMMIDGG